MGQGRCLAAIAAVGLVIAKISIRMESILVILLRLEFLGLGAFLRVGVRLPLASLSLFVGVVILTFMVGEARLGLCLLVSNARERGVTGLAI